MEAVNRGLSGSFLEISANVLDSNRVRKHLILKKLASAERNNTLKCSHFVAIK